MPRRRCQACGESKLANTEINSASDRCYQCKDAGRTAGFIAKKPIRDPEITRSSNLRALYGITAAEFDAMAAGQEGLCAICRRGSEAFAERRRPGRPRADGQIASVQWLQVDHCHETGQVRGLLCPDCNTGIARFADSIQRLQAAAKYLSGQSGDSSAQRSGPGVRRRWC